MKEGYVDIKHGDMYYKVLGKGEPILFIHGGPGLVHNYFLPYFLELVNKGYQLIFYDQRGNGKSYKAFDESNINLNEFTLDIERLRKHLKIDKLNIVGHSMGGFFALDYAKKFNKRVKKITLCNCIPIDIANLGIMNTVINERIKFYINEISEIVNSQKFKDNDTTTIIKYLTLINSVNFYDKSRSNELFKDMEISPYFMKNFKKINKKLLNEYINIIDKYNLDDIHIPTLIIHSEFDFISIESSEYINYKLQNSNIKFIKKCGHYSFIEKTEEVLESLDEFLLKY
ncbi:hypothetical protein C3495_02140 [Clostridiaceae bacterium 14S0207]|nr:hypothetical protein C3495_02140 [Clostridiaceae bacterium 14S0207]